MWPMSLMSDDLYTLLQVKQHATTEEIKAAFKKRALEVHPDKGGSKEAFHLVYRALETLSDPEARKKYDGRYEVLLGMSSTPRSAFGKMRRPQFCGKFPFAKQPSKSDLRSNKSNAGGGDRTTQPAYVTRCIAEVHDLLKQLPRDVRFEVIRKDFSQQQRLLLEKWMGETMEKPASPEVPQDIPSASRDAKGFPGSARVKFQTRDAHRRGKESAKAGHKCKSGHAGIQSMGGRFLYRAAVYVEKVQVSSKTTNLPTALEYLMLLTSAKQKMLSDNHSDDAFEDRLEQSLMSASMEQGKSYQTLTLYFGVLQGASILIGKKTWRFPRVQSCAQLKKLRRCTEPLREAFNSSTFRFKNSFERLSPQELGDLWEKFQEIAAETCQIAGQHADAHLQLLNVWYTKTAPVRDRLLRDWERRHMCSEDHEYYKPESWRHCPPIALKPKNPLVALKQLLARWRHWLQQERLRSQAKRSQGLRRMRNQEHVQKRPKKTGNVIWML